MRTHTRANSKTVSARACVGDGIRIKRSRGKCILDAETKRLPTTFVTFSCPFYPTVPSRSRFRHLRFLVVLTSLAGGFPFSPFSPFPNVTPSASYALPGKQPLLRFSWKDPAESFATISRDNRRRTTVALTTLAFLLFSCPPSECVCLCVCARTHKRGVFTGVRVASKSARECANKYARERRRKKN